MIKKRRFIRLWFLLLVLIILLASGCESSEILDVNNNLQPTESSDSGIINGIVSYAENNSDTVGTAEESKRKSNDSIDEKDSKEVEKENKNTADYKTDIDEYKTNADKEAQENIFIEVYYQDLEGFVIPVTRRIPRQLSVARAAVNGLVDTPVNREEMAYFGLIPILPKGTVFTINLKDKTAVIDFNSRVLDYTSEKSEYNIVSSIVYTLTQFESIDDVIILINGYEQEKLRYGTDISGRLSRKNILVNAVDANKVNLKKGLEKIDVYLLRSLRDVGNKGNEGSVDNTGKNDNVFLFPVSVETEKVNTNKFIANIMRYLSSDEQKPEIFSAVKPGIMLNESTIEDGLLTLDIGFDNVSYGGTLNEYLMVNQIMHSMRQISGVNRIRFLIDGKAITLPEGTDISKPVLLPAKINDIIDDEVFVSR